MDKLNSHEAPLPELTHINNNQIKKYAELSHFGTNKQTALPSPDLFWINMVSPKKVWAMGVHDMSKPFGFFYLRDIKIVLSRRINDHHTKEGSRLR